MNEKSQLEASACLEAIAELCKKVNIFTPTVLTEYEILPLRVLLDHVEALMNGKVEARARKNAGDRKRRATKKAPGRKPRVMDPVTPPHEYTPDDARIP